MKARSWIVSLLAASTLFLTGCAVTKPQSAANPDSQKAQITILYDAFGKPSAMEKDWGFAALIEYGGKRILFDTGDDPDILARNVKAKNVDLSKLTSWSCRTATATIWGG